MSGTPSRAAAPITGTHSGFTKFPFDFTKIIEQREQKTEQTPNGSTFSFDISKLQELFDRFKK